MQNEEIIRLGREAGDEIGARALELGSRFPGEEGSHAHNALVAYCEKAIRARQVDAWRRGMPQERFELFRSACVRRIEQRLTFATCVVGGPGARLAELT